VAGIAIKVCGLLLGIVLWAGSVCAAGQAPPVIGIIIDDLGYKLKAGQRAVALTGNITYAFLPHAPFAARLAERAYRHGKEIMLHLPMQAEAGNNLGPSALTAAQSEQRFKHTLHSALSAIPHVRGFNNHMGSYLTKNTRRMRWLMEAAMFHNNIYFVDSRTTAESVAQKEAKRLGIDNTKRDVFLDYEQNEAIIQQQLQLLIKRAKRKGSALAIGHPYPETLAALEAWLPTLAKEGVHLVQVSELIRLRQNYRRSRLWQVSSSR